MIRRFLPSACPTLRDPASSGIQAVTVDRFGFWLVIALTVGAVRHYVVRDGMDPDALSYLDIADEFVAGEWRSAVNAYWSPLYPLLIGLAKGAFLLPDRFDFRLAHGVNYAIFLASFVAFHWFMREFVTFVRSIGTIAGGSAERAIQVAGYSLFLWSSFELTQPRLITPDPLVAAGFYGICTLLLRNRRATMPTGDFILLGVVLAFAYLSKSAMLPIGTVALFVAAMCTPDRRRSMRGVAVAAATALLLAAPFVITLSLQKGRLTFGDSGKLNYAWYVNGVERWTHWQGESGGAPVHPTKKIHDVPAVFLFADPFGRVVHSPWFDPSYWYEGLQAEFDARQQLAAIRVGLRGYGDLLLGLTPQAGAILLLLLGSTARASIRPIFCAFLPVLLPAFALCGMYLLVHLEPRFIAAPIVIVVLCAFAAVAMTIERSKQRLLATGAIAIAIASVAAITAGGVRDAAIVPGRADIHYRVADALAGIGVEPGDAVATIGSGYEAYWARIAGVRIVAEQPWDAEKDPTPPRFLRHEQMGPIFRPTGATVVVTCLRPDSVEGWLPLASTGCYAMKLGSAS